MIAAGLVGAVLAVGAAVAFREGPPRDGEHAAGNPDDSTSSVELGGPADSANGGAPSDLALLAQPNSNRSSVDATITDMEHRVDRLESRITDLIRRAGPPGGPQGTR